MQTAAEDASIHAAPRDWTETVRCSTVGCLVDVHWRGLAAGIVFFRHGRGSRKFLDGWDTALRRNASLTEQQAFNAVARAGVKPLKTHPDNWRVFYGMGRSVTFGILPASAFANGHSYFVQRLYEVLPVRQLLT